MSEKDLKPKEHSDEIDLGQLFKMIGDMFNRLFAFIGTIFKYLFSMILWVLIVARKHFVKIMIIGAVGGIVGFVIDSFKEPIYGGNLVVEPKFGSALQLYDNIRYYHSLTQDMDSVQLAKIFNIEVGQAAEIQGFYIDPDDNENKKLTYYSDVISNMDSMARTNFTFQEFSRNLEPTDNRYHKIGIASTDKTIFPMLQSTIINGIANNKYFQRKRDVSLQNIAINDSLLKLSIFESDSLRKSIMRLKEKAIENNKIEPTTNIVLSENRESNDEVISLLERKLRIKDQLNQNRVDRIENQQIIKVISDFPEEGYIEDSFMSEYKFLIPSTLVLTYILLMMLKELNEYLIRKEKELKDLA